MPYYTDQNAVTYPPKTSSGNYQSDGVIIFLILLALFIGIIVFYFLKSPEVFYFPQFYESQNHEVETLNPLRVRSDLNVELNNVHFENDQERWLQHVTPSIVRQQQRLLESTAQVPSTSHGQQFEIEVHQTTQSRILHDMPPIYDVPPSYEECTLKPD